MNRPAFTLIKLMLVIGILSILASIVVVAIAGEKEKAVEQEKSDRIHSLIISD